MSKMIRNSTDQGSKQLLPWHALTSLRNDYILICSPNPCKRHWFQIKFQCCSIFQNRSLALLLLDVPLNVSAEQRKAASQINITSTSSSAEGNLISPTADGRAGGNGGGEQAVKLIVMSGYLQEQ